MGACREGVAIGLTVTVGRGVATAFGTGVSKEMADREGTTGGGRLEARDDGAVVGNGSAIVDCGDAVGAIDAGGDGATNPIWATQSSGVERGSGTLTAVRKHLPNNGTRGSF